MREIEDSIDLVQAYEYANKGLNQTLHVKITFKPAPAPMPDANPPEFLKDEDYDEGVEDQVLFLTISISSTKPNNFQPPIFVPMT